MQITNKVVYLHYNNTNKVVITMRTENFIQAVDEIKNNGGTRETMYIKEAWKDREMTIFGYADDFKKNTSERADGDDSYF